MIVDLLIPGAVVARWRPLRGLPLLLLLIGCSGSGKETDYEDWPIEQIHMVVRAPANTFDGYEAEGGCWLNCEYGLQRTWKIKIIQPDPANPRILHLNGQFIAKSAVFDLFATLDSIRVLHS